MHESAEVRERRWAPGLEEQDQTVHHQPGVQPKNGHFALICMNQDGGREDGAPDLDEQD